MPRLFVLDAMGLAYRAYYAFIRRPLMNSRGENTSAIFGFANSAMKIRREESPDYWALAWDGPGPTFRHQRFPDYKATRKPMPTDLLSQIPAIEDLANAIGLPLLEIPGYEADDVMATLAVEGERAGLDVVLVTGDKDMLQLVDDHVKVLCPTARDEYVWFDRAAVQAKWSVAPEQLRDVLALMGDTSDNIPGVPGVGEKTAVELIVQFGSLEALYQRLPEVKRPALREKLEAHRDLAMLSRDLVTVKTDCELPVTIEALRRAPVRREALLVIAKRYEIVRLERLAADQGVGDDDAGARVHARSAERRGTAAETPAAGVKLAAPPAFFGRATGDAAASEPSAPEPRTPAPPARTPPDAFDLEREADAAFASEGARVAPPPAFEGVASVAAPPAPESPARAAAPPAPASGALDRVRREASAPAPQGSLDLFAAAESGNGAEASFADTRSLEDALHEVRARALHGVAVLPVLDGGDARASRIAGLALAARDGSACYVPLAHGAGPLLDVARVREWIGPLLLDSRTPKLAADGKALLHVLARLELPLAGLDLDLRLASFVCDPARDHSLEALARDVLGVELPPLEVPPARGRPRTPASSRAVQDILQAACAHAAAIPPLAEALRAQIEAREQWSLYEKIERPLALVLCDMERAGVRLDSATLAEMAARAGEEIMRLEFELLALAGEPLNLNSGPQIAKLLFETFKLKSGRKTKTGLSTDQATLEELADEHPFPRLLLEYRALSKLKSTYLDALPQVVDPADGRVHTTYDQAGAATGRLSSSNPNLQNIPIRTAQGRAIRRAFTAPPGTLLVGADYSQVELRVMAHLSEDPNLIEAFRSGEDVHAGTARRIFGVTGDLDPALRARAKIVNFGVMYGMGARSLSQQMEIPLEEAQTFIADYFRVYARVRDYLDRTLEDARRRGFVETLLGRRRYLPALGSTHGGERSNAERAAINTPIQGSAADLMKLAMIRVHRVLKQRHPSSRLLLQVHDELVLEAPEAEAEAVGSLVKSEMEGSLELRVPLEVSVGHGRTWFDVH